MKFRINKVEFAEALLSVSKTCAPKTATSSLSGALISLSGNSLTLTGYDLDAGTKITLSADGETDGSIVIDAKFATELIRRMPEDYVEINLKSDEIFFSSGKAKGKFKIVSSSDYPNITELSQDIKFEAPENYLRYLIASQKHAASATNGFYPNLAGMRIEKNGEEITFASTDSMRLAINKESAAFFGLTSEENFAVTVPEKILSELVRVLSPDSEDKVTIIVDKNQVLFSKNGYTIFGRTLDGKFVDYRRISAANPSRLATFDSKELMETLERVSPFVSDRIKNPVYLSFPDYKDGEITARFYCRSSIGELEEELNATLKIIKDETEAINNEQNENSANLYEIAFNPFFAVDALKSCQSDEITLGFKKDVDPIKFIPGKESAAEPTALYVIVPVRK